MRVLLTGGAGYIGTHTCICLLEAGHEVSVLDNYCNSSPEAVRRVEKITGKKVPVYEGDCCDAAFVNSVLDDQSFDAVIHFAGLKAVGESVRIPLNYYQNNLGATLTLCQAMSAHGVKRIVFSSSATVYGATASLPMREDLPMGECTNPYGWTKWMSERILRDLSTSDPDWSVTLLRYFNPVGAHESGMIGEDPSGIPNNLMPFICQTAAGRLPVLNIYGDDYPTPDGTCIRDYIHVMDLAEGHVKALEHAVNRVGVEVFNLGTGEGYSVLEMVHTFNEVNHLQVPYRIAPRRPGDAPSCYSDPRRAEEKLHWKATRSLGDMCRDAWHWQSLNPMGYKEQ